MKPLLRTATWALVLASQGTAWGALTSSEKGQLASYVAEGRVATADRVRALVARPDLSADESAEALSAAVAPLAFTDARAAYLHEMLYGAASVPSRSVVAVAVTRAVAARADAVMGRHEADLDQDDASIAELARLFAFVDGDVANAGQPRGAAHDPSAGIGASSYDDAGRALAAVVEHHPRWLKGDALIPAAAAPVRAQLQLALFDLANDTVTRRFDVADRLGVAGPRRAALTELGVLILDDGHADAAKVERTRGLLARVGGARDGVEAVALFEPRAPLKARGDVLVLRAPPARPAGSPWSDDVSGPPVDPELATMAKAIADVAVRRALEARPDLRAQADKDVAAVKGDPHRALGVPADGSTVQALSAAVQLLEIDAPTTIDLALARLLAGYSEPASVLSDALGALASLAPAAQGGPVLTLGRSREPAGTLAVTNVRVAAAGFVTGFTVGGHAFTLSRDDAGAVSAKRDGAAITVAMLESARVPVSVAPVWSAGGTVFAKLSGAPRAGVAAGGRVRLIGDGRSVDAITTAAPADDVVVEASLEVTGEAAVVVRAASTPAGFRGAALVIDASASPTRASIRSWDDAGKLTELMPAVELPASPKLAVKVTAKGGKLEARVGTTTLRADLPPGLTSGDIALAARHGSSVEATGWTVKRP